MPNADNKAWQRSLSAAKHSSSAAAAQPPHGGCSAHMVHPHTATQPGLIRLLLDQVAMLTAENQVLTSLVLDLSDTLQQQQQSRTLLDLQRQQVLKDQLAQLQAQMAVGLLLDPHPAAAACATSCMPGNAAGAASTPRGCINSSTIEDTVAAESEEDVTVGLPQQPVTLAMPQQQLQQHESCPSSSLGSCELHCEQDKEGTGQWLQDWQTWCEMLPLEKTTSNGSSGGSSNGSLLLA